MVAVGSDPKQRAKEETTKTAAVAATYELRKSGRQIAPWHARAAPKDRERWTEEVQENLRTAAPGIPAYILNGPPTIQQVTTIYKGASQEAIATHFAAAMMEYQMYNTALWDAIEPSLRFEGAYEAMDRLQRKEFMNTPTRAPRGAAVRARGRLGEIRLSPFSDPNSHAQHYTSSYPNCHTSSTAPDPPEQPPPQQQPPFDHA